MSKQFDLEQGIMQCWNLVDELKAVKQYCTSRNSSAQEVLEVLDALVTIYQIKFENTFETFEGFISEYYAAKRNSEKVAF